MSHPSDSDYEFELLESWMDYEEQKRLEPEEWLDDDSDNT